MPSPPMGNTYTIVYPSPNADRIGSRSILVPHEHADARMMSDRGMTHSSSVNFHNWYMQYSRKSRMHLPKGCVLLDLGRVLSEVEEYVTFLLGDDLDLLDLPVVICSRGHAGLYQMRRSHCPYCRFVEVFAHGAVFVSECTASQPYHGGRPKPLRVMSNYNRGVPCPAIEIDGDKGDLAALLPYPVFLVDDKQRNLDAVVHKGKPGSWGFHVGRDVAPDFRDWTQCIEAWEMQL